MHISIKGIQVCGCTPFDPLVDTETPRRNRRNMRPGSVAPPSIRLWILKLRSTTRDTQTGLVAPPSIRLWILKHALVRRTACYDAVAPPSIRLWILKLFIRRRMMTKTKVAPPSIRLWILKRPRRNMRPGSSSSCTPFDPLVDTETFPLIILNVLNLWLHPLRSACGY